MVKTSRDVELGVQRSRWSVAVVVVDEQGPATRRVALRVHGGLNRKLVATETEAVDKNILYIHLRILLQDASFV